jgi:DNA-binding NarL/FixJ family response regulator
MLGEKCNVEECDMSTKGKTWWAKAAPWALERLEKLPVGSEARVALERLSGRELEVFLLRLEGLNPKQIGAKLFLSPSTVAVHAFNLRCKLGIEKGEGAVLRLGVKWGMVS